MDTSQQESPAVGLTPAQIDPVVLAGLEALPSGEIDIPRLLEHMAEGGPEAAAAAEVQAAQRPLYPIGSTAVWALMLTVVNIIEIDGDRRRVQWKKLDDKYSNRDWVEMDKLSQSDDPATVAALAAKAEHEAHFAKGRWAIYKSPDGEIYVKIAEVKANERKITYIDDVYAAETYAEHWVDIKELKPVLHQEGEMALFNGQVARIEEVEEDRRKIVYLKETEYFASDTQLKPIPSDDHAGIEIAQLEINLAKQRDELQARIASLEVNLSLERDEVARLTRDYDAKLKAQLERANTLADERDKIKRDLGLRIGQLRTALGAMPDNNDMDYLEHLLMHSMAELKGEIAALKAQGQPEPTACRKIEIKTLVQHVSNSYGSTIVEADKELAERLNEGWATLHITVIDNFSMDGGEGSAFPQRIVTLQREVQDEAHPPMEAHVAAPAPEPDARQVWEDALRPDEEEIVEVSDLVQEPVMQGAQPETRKLRPVLPAKTTGRIPHARQIHRDLEGWKASQNAKLLQVGNNAYQACLDSYGPDDDDDPLRLTRPQPYRPGFTIVMGQVQP